MANATFFHLVSEFFAWVWGFFLLVPDCFIGIIIEAAFGAAIVGAAIYMYSDIGGDPKRPSQSLIEKIKKVFREHKMELAGATTTLVFVLDLLIHTGYHFKNGTEPDYSWVENWLIHRTYDPKEHGVGNPLLKPFEDHMLETLDYCSRPEVANNNLLKITRYLSFDPARLHSSQVPAFIECYNPEITTFLHSVSFEQFIAHSPVNERNLVRHMEFLSSNPSLCTHYETRFIGFIQNLISTHPRN